MKMILRNMQAACEHAALKFMLGCQPKKPRCREASGFFRAIFQGGIQKISFPKNDLWGGLELNSKDIKGGFCDFFATRKNV